MAETTTFVANAPVWIDLSTTDPAAARNFYAKLFGWQAQPEADPAAGGYALARIGGKDVAGIGGSQDPNAPPAWMVYIGTKDADATAKKIEAAGGRIIAPPFDVMDVGRMAVIQDPVGAFIALWQPKSMPGYQVSNKPGAFAWAELTARGVEKAKEFYTKAFGWTTKESPMGEGQPMYTEFQLQGTSILGALEAPPTLPAEVPSYWQIYFAVEDVDKGFKQAIDLGAKELVAPMDFPGGRFAIVQDPQGAVFGLLKTAA